MLRHTPPGQEGKGRVSLAQHDNKRLFCHSEEQRDEESRGYAKVSLNREGHWASDHCAEKTFFLPNNAIAHWQHVMTPH